MPPFKHRFTISALLLLGLAPALARGQEAEEKTAVLRAGTHTIELPFPTNEGNAGFGIWKMRSGRTSLGIVGSVGFSRLSEDNDTIADTRTSIDLTLGPALKRYHRLHPTVVGFGTVSLQGTVRQEELGEFDQKTTTWGGFGSAGVGAEWFPFSRVSIGGTTGVNAGWTTSDRDDGVELNRSYLFLQTFTTSVRMFIYF